MLYTLMRRLAPGLLPFLCAVALVACGGSGTSATPTPTIPALGGPTVSSTIIPGIPLTPPALTPPAIPTPPAAPPPAATYTVLDGDNPTAIARRLNIPDTARDAWVQQLLSLNQTTANALRPGQVLTLPPPGPTDLTSGPPVLSTPPPLGQAVGTPPPNLPLPPNLSTPGPAQAAPSVGAPPATGSPCQAFSTQRARDWCSRPFAAPSVTCADFAKATGEATRFTKGFDPLDVNGLDPDHDGRSCDDK
jgi:hypothetical protein